MAPVWSLNSPIASADGLNSLLLPPDRSARPSGMPSIRISCEYSWPPLIDPLKVSPVVPGQAVKNELLDLALSVTDHDGPALVFFGRDVAADLSTAGFDKLRLRADHHLLGDRADFHLDVGRLGLRYAQHYVLLPWRCGNRERSRESCRFPPADRAAYMCPCSWSSYWFRRAVALFLATTVAPGTTAPAGSVTVPTIVPTGPCATKQSGEDDEKK